MAMFYSVSGPQVGANSRDRRTVSTQLHRGASMQHLGHRQQFVGSMRVARFRNFGPATGGPGGRDGVGPARSAAGAFAFMIAKLAVVRDQNTVYDR